MESIFLNDVHEEVREIAEEVMEELEKRNAKTQCKTDSISLRNINLGFHMNSVYSPEDNIVTMPDIVCESSSAVRALPPRIASTVAGHSKPRRFD